MFCNYCGAPNPDVAAFCNKCGKAVAGTPANAPIQAQPITAQPTTYVTETPPPEPPSTPAPVVVALPTRQETSTSIRGTLSSTARTEFTNGLIAELRRQVEDKCFPGAIAAWVLTLVVVARYSITAFGTKTGLVIALAVAFVIAGIVFKVVKGVLEDKYLRPIADLSDEMLVNRYNEAKADRRAARTRTAISWAVIAIIVVVLVIAWVAGQRH